MYMKNLFSIGDGFLHGADYNPEQWLEYPEILDKDIEFMKKAHCNVMTIGIFSWSFLEPQEGQYNFEYFDKIIDNLTQNNIKIILSTPSGAKPRWLAEKYPETLRVNKDNRREMYGGRENHCYTSPIYRNKIKKLDRMLAERYSGNDNVIMWHISNEFCGECHCDLCQEAFRTYLKNKYNNSLEKLNDAWWTGFWSHTVTSWEQIHSPVNNGEGDGIMTGLYMDWRDFVTYQTTDFMNEEINAVKSVNPNIPVTTNFMGPYQNLNYHYMKDFVDVISWDAYPAWHSDRGNICEAYSIAFAHDLHRSFKNKPFILMESTPSLTNWLPYNKLKKAGMHKLSSMQAVAHGSDSVQYFQWRKGRGGSEKFHGAVIDHNGKAEGRVFDDVKQVGIALEKIREVAGTKTKSEVAVVYEFRNRWAIDNSSGFNNADKKYKRTCINHYKQFWKRGINVDVIGIDSDLSKYKLVVLPMLYSLSEKQIDNIKLFVRNGGTVVATYMTGYANETDLCYLGGFPGGALKEVFGLTSDEIDTLYENDFNTVLMNDKSYKVIDYCELVTPLSAEVIGTYEEDFYKGKPAVLRNIYSKGKAYYIACRDTDKLLEDFYGEILKETAINSYRLPEGVSIHTRGDDDNTYLFVENYTDKEQNIMLRERFLDIENDMVLDETILLKAYDVRILKKV